MSPVEGTNYSVVQLVSEIVLIVIIKKRKSYTARKNLFFKMKKHIFYSLIYTQVNALN